MIFMTMIMMMMKIMDSECMSIVLQDLVVVNSEINQFLFRMKMVENSIDLNEYLYKIC